MELFGEKYILNSKYDADGKCNKNRCDLDMREVQIEQNLPFLLAIGLPSKIDANAKCFMSWGEDEERFLATCDSSRLILGSIGDVDKEYSLSGFVKQSGKKVESDVTFIHNDEDLEIAVFGGSVPKRVHYFASGGVSCYLWSLCSAHHVIGWVIVDLKILIRNIFQLETRLLTLKQNLIT